MTMRNASMPVHWTSSRRLLAGVDAAGTTVPRRRKARAARRRPAVRV